MKYIITSQGAYKIDVKNKVAFKIGDTNFSKQRFEEYAQFLFENISSKKFSELENAFWQENAIGYQWQYEEKKYVVSDNLFDVVVNNKATEPHKINEIDTYFHHGKLWQICHTSGWGEKEYKKNGARFGLKSIYSTENKITRWTCAKNLFLFKELA